MGRFFWGGGGGVGGGQAGNPLKLFGLSLPTPVIRSSSI